MQSENREQPYNAGEEEEAQRTWRELKASGADPARIEKPDANGMSVDDLKREFRILSGMRRIFEDHGDTFPDEFEERVAHIQDAYRKKMSGDYIDMPSDRK